MHDVPELKGLQRHRRLDEQKSLLLQVAVHEIGIQDDIIIFAVVAKTDGGSLLGPSREGKSPLRGAEHGCGKGV